MIIMQRQHSAQFKRRQVMGKKFNTQLRIVCSTTGLLSASLAWLYLAR